jgi:hypothetical protein
MRHVNWIVLFVPMAVTAKAADYVWVEAERS